MVRREAIVSSAVAGAAVLIPKWILPFSPLTVPSGTMKQFSALWRDGQLAFYFSENHRALGIFQRTFRLAVRLDSEKQADALEMVSKAREAVAYDESQLPEERTEVEADPSSLSKRLRLAIRLQQLGRYVEAEEHYRQVLSHKKELLAIDNATLWPHLGKYHYRIGQYREAAKWFERTPDRLASQEKITNSPMETLELHIMADASLNRLLVALALGNNNRARTLASTYISKLGRLPWPYCYYLHRAGIDADAIYVQANRALAKSG